MKKKILMMMLSGIMVMPVTVMAQNDGGGHGDGQDNLPHRSPSNSLVQFVLNESCGITTVIFGNISDSVEIDIHLDGFEVDSQTFTVEAGTQVPLYLPAYGSGEFTIYVRRGTTLLAFYSTTI